MERWEKGGRAKGEENTRDTRKSQALKGVRTERLNVDRSVSLLESIYISPFYCALSMSIVDAQMKSRRVIG